VIRRLNYTGRRNIARSAVTIRLLEERDGERAFTAEYDLSGLRFPADARVYIEAYNSDSYMRFAFGSVSEPRVPKDTRLAEITPRPLPKFRLKVVDETRRHGLLLGVADRVIALRRGEDLERKDSLLPVDFVDLGERVWRLDLADSPVLELNKRIESISAAARGSGGFIGLLYPEVLRRILHEIVVVEAHTDPSAGDDDWKTLWLRYACSVPGVEVPPNEAAPDARERRAEWVERAVESFCRARDARRKFENALCKELG
jgi:hypothetical protein